MIAKVVPNRKHTSSVAKLARYITGLKAEGDPAGWPALADYITDARSDGARVDHVRLTNLDSDDLGPAVKEILVTQALNTRSKADKNYHLVVSFPPGERPTREQLDDIEDELCAAIGLADHQRISAAHDDKDHFHVHIAINKVHPVTYRNVTPGWDHPRLQRTCAELEKKHGLTVTNHGEAVERGPKGKAADMEAHAGRESLATWIRDNAAAELVKAAEQATSWRELHAAAELHGLEWRPRGAGMTIGATGGREAVKASDVDRRLAFKALTDRLGPFEPRQQQADQQQGGAQAQPKQQYRKAPRHKVAGTAQLFAEYQRERDAALAARKAARDKVAADRQAFAATLRLSHATRRRLVQQDRQRTREQKRNAYRMLGAERQQSFRQNRAALATERASIDAANPLPTWQAFLEGRAARGDTLATAALRSRTQMRQRFAFDVLSAEDAEAAKHVVYKELSPKARRNGDLVYQVRDGGRVTDTASNVRVDELTVGAAFLALSLAADRYGDRPLKVDGSDEFKAQIAAMAAMQGLAVRFADPAMETARDRVAEQQRTDAAAQPRPAPAAPQTPPAPAPAPLDPVAEYARQRNETRGRISDIDHHRPWTASDAGTAEYGGRRTLADGSEAVLLQKGGETLVKPVTAAQAAKASKWRVGEEVTTDNRGRFTGDRRRGR